MNEVNRIINLISGRNNKSCYQELSCAVIIALEALPEHPPMKAIQIEVARRLAKDIKSTSAARALSRAAEDIWQYGNRERLEELFGRPLLEQPTAKSLVFTMAEYIKNTSSGENVLYTLWPSLFSYGHGIIGQSPNQRVAVSPVDADLESLTRLIQYLNRNQVPLEVFLERFLDNPQMDPENL